MCVVMGIIMGVLDPMNKWVRRTNSRKRSEFYRLIEMWSHLPKSEVADI